MIDVLGQPIGIGDYVFGTGYTGKNSAAVWFINDQTKLMWWAKQVSPYGESNRIHKQYTHCIKLTPEQVVKIINNTYATVHATKVLKEFKLI